MSTLIYHSGALGDFIACLPLLSQIGDGPYAPITLISNSNSITLASASGYITDAIAIDHPCIRPLFHDKPDNAAVTGLIRPYSLILLFTASDSTLAENVRKYATVPLIVHPPFPQKRIPIAEYHLKVFREIDSSVELPPAIPQLLLSPAGDKKPVICTSTSRPLLIIHPGSGSTLKNWPFDRFMKVAAAFRKRSEIIWLTGPAEESLPVPSSGRHVHQPLLLECCRLLQEASVFLGNDGGIAHLAAALGTPAVVLFGPSDPLVWAPGGVNRVKVLHHAQSCGPCHPSVFPRKECPGECLSSITVKEVISVVEEFFHTDYP